MKKQLLAAEAEWRPWALGVFALLLFLFAGLAFAHAQTPTLTTDQQDYAPGQTVNITGTAFEPQQAVVLTLTGTATDSSIAMSTTWAVSADGQGSFATQYVLPSTFIPTYLLSANTTDGVLLAQTSFTDTVKTTSLTLVNNGPNPSTDGQAVSFTATVNTTGNPNCGSVAFKDNGTTFATVGLSGSSASTSYTGLSVGAHANITATYTPSGGCNYLGSDSNAVSQTVNATTQPPATVTVTIDKYIDSSMATAVTAASLAFPMSASWDATNLGAGTGSYTLSTAGFNSANPYEAVTSDMSSSASYSTSEQTSGNAIVGASCADGNPYYLAGYSVGDSLAQAQAAGPSATVPSFTNITSNKYVIVWNRPCLPAPAPVSPPNNAFLTTALLQKIDWTDVSDPFTPTTYLYEVTNSNATTSSGSFVAPIYTSGWTLSASEIPTPNTPPGTYYWHVKAKDADGNESPWSVTQVVVVSNTPLALTQNGGTADAYNLVGTQHTVVANIGVSLSGVPALFVVSGANPQTATVNTDASGQATFTYTGTNSGVDTITSCVDFDHSGTCDGAAELTSNALTKYWFTKFMTGGGNYKTSTNFWTFGGNVGLDSSNHPAGEFEVSQHGTTNYHFNTITGVALSADHKTVDFDATGWVQGSKTPVAAHFTIYDNGTGGKAKADTISISGDVVLATSTLTGGNFQVFVQ